MTQLCTLFRRVHGQFLYGFLPIWTCKSPHKNIIEMLPLSWQPRTCDIVIFDAFPMAELYIMFIHSFYSYLGFFEWDFLQFEAKNDPITHIRLYWPCVTTKISMWWIIFDALPMTKLCTLWHDYFGQIIRLLKAFHNF